MPFLISLYLEGALFAIDRRVAENRFFTWAIASLEKVGFLKILEPWRHSGICLTSCVQKCDEAIGGCFKAGGGV